MRYDAEVNRHCRELVTTTVLRGHILNCSETWKSGTNRNHFTSVNQTRFRRNANVVMGAHSI